MGSELTYSVFRTALPTSLVAFLQFCMFLFLFFILLKHKYCHIRFQSKNWEDVNLVTVEDENFGGDLWFKKRFTFLSFC